MRINNKYNLAQIRYKRGGKIIEYFRVDGNGKSVYYTTYIKIGDGFAKVLKNGKWGILNPCGKIWGRTEFSGIDDKFSEGIIRVYQNGKVGYADKETGRFIECVFDSGEDFKNGVAKVIYRGKERTINTIGKFVD